MSQTLTVVLSFLVGSSLSAEAALAANKAKKVKAPHSKIQVQSVCTGDLSYSYTDEWGMERQDLIPKTLVILEMGPKEKLVQAFLRVKGDSRAASEILSAQILKQNPRKLRELAAVCLGRSSIKDLKKSEVAAFRKRLLDSKKVLRIVSFDEELSKNQTRLEAYVLKNHKLKPVRLSLRSHAGS